MALDLSDDEEIGEFIYRTSHTAKLLREKQEKKNKEDEEKSRIDTEMQKRWERLLAVRRRNSPPSSVNCTNRIERCNGNKAAGNESCETKRQRRKVRSGYVYICKHDGCTNRVVNSGVCQRHGAVVKRKPCTYDGCANLAISRGFCTKHGAKRYEYTCKHEGCTNQVQNRGVCVKHGAAKQQRKSCNHEGCNNQVQNNGVCIKHGAKRYTKTCSHDECAKQAKKRGVRTRHGAESKGETDDEDTNTTKFTEKPINIKEEAVKVEVKTEDDDISTDDDEHSPEYAVSSSSGYDPVKSEATDQEDLDDKDTNTSKSNEQHLPIVKAEVKTEDDVSMDDEYSSAYNSEIEVTGKQRQSPRTLTNHTTQSNELSTYDIDKCTTKKKRKRKREPEERDGSVQKAVCIQCSIEGCNRKAAGNGRCKRQNIGGGITVAKMDAQTRE